MTDGLVMDMANLMAMRFGAFEFPVNPAELKVAHRALLRESVAPGGAEQVQRVGAYKRRVSGKGYFTGETAMADYLRLEALFGTVQTLFLPGRAPFEAVLSELSLLGVEAKQVVGYSFQFVETGGAPSGLSGRTYRARGGESLWDYAYFSGAPIDALVKANRHIACIGALQEGEEVHIP